MVTFAQAAARKTHALVRRVTLEGIGEYAGQWSFYDRAPGYLTPAQRALAKPWLVKGSLPTKFPEEGNPLGGADVAGEVSFAISDGLGSRRGGSFNALTAIIGTDTPPDFELAAAIDADDDTGIVIEGIASKIALVVEKVTVLFFGAEAWLVEEITASTATSLTLTITRAGLDTEAQAHDARSSGWLYVPYLAGRRIRVFVGFDLPTFAQSSEKELGPGWRIDGDEMTEGLGGYVFRGASSLSTINRQVYRRAFSGIVAQISGGNDEHLVRLSIAPESLRDNGPASCSHFGNGVFFKHGNEEILMGSFPNVGIVPELVTIDRTRRALCGTKRTAFEEGETFTQVFAAWGADNRSSFAFQEPGAETTSRSTGSWIRSVRCEHPVPQALCLMLSSAAPGNKDGLELTNWVAGSGNFSALPPGAGAGIPIGEVDYDSAHRLWWRTLDWRIPWLVLERSEPLRECLEREILRLTGILLTTRNGKLYFDLPTVPVLGATGIVFDETKILAERIGKGIEQSRLGDRGATELGAPTVKFRTRKPGGGEHPIIINDADYPAVMGFVRSKFGLDTGVIDIPARGIPIDRAGGARLVEQVALRNLTRFRKPPREHPFTTDFSFIDAGDIGTQALLSHPDLVDRRNRTRGIEDLVIWVKSKVPDLETGEIDWKVLAFAIAGKYGLNPPSAIITGVAGNVATVRTNRYTAPDAPLSLNIPRRDCDAFATTNVCILRDRAGAIVSGATTQVISAITSGSDQITFDGNFAGALAIGRVITWASYDACTAEQQLSYVFFADATTLGLGAAEVNAFRYGER